MNMSLIETAKRFGFLNWLNSQLKSSKLKREWAKLSNNYQKRAVKLGFSYDSDLAIGKFKNWHQKHAPEFTASTRRSLRVFWVGSNLNQDESGFLQALRRLADVTVFHNFEGHYGTWSGQGIELDTLTFDHIRKVNDKELIEQVSRAHEIGGIDVLIGQMWADRISKEALLEVKNMGIPVINISMDDRLPSNWGLEGDIRLGSVGLVPGVTLVLTTSIETCLWYGVEGCPAVFWPLASSKEVFGSSSSEARDIDVLFIGNRYGVRNTIIKYLIKHGVNIECYGQDWPNGYINTKEMASLSKRAKIILGIGAIGHCSDMYTLKLRDFDAPVSGALYLTQRNPDLCELFAEGEEIECYQTCREALDKIHYYLRNHSERQKIASRGLKRVLTDHTWDTRLMTTFSDLGLMSQNISDVSK
jgi:spore maturation protein CgeB